MLIWEKCCFDMEYPRWSVHFGYLEELFEEYFRIQVCSILLIESVFTSYILFLKTMFTSDIFFSKSVFTSADKIFCFQSQCLQFALWEWVFVFDFNYFCQRSGLLGIHSVCSLRSWLVENYFFREAGAGFSYFGRKVFRQADECVLNFCWLLHPHLLINAPFTCFSWFAYDWLPPT